MKKFKNLREDLASRVVNQRNQAILADRAERQAERDANRSAATRASNQFFSNLANLFGGNKKDDDETPTTAPDPNELANAIRQDVQTHFNPNAPRPPAPEELNWWQRQGSKDVNRYNAELRASKPNAGTSSPEREKGPLGHSSNPMFPTTATLRTPQELQQAQREFEKIRDYNREFGSVSNTSLYGNDDEFHAFNPMQQEFLKANPAANIRTMSQDLDGDIKTSSAMVGGDTTPEPNAASMSRLQNPKPGQTDWLKVTRDRMSEYEKNNPNPTFSNSPAIVRFGPERTVTAAERQSQRDAAAALRANPPRGSVTPRPDKTFTSQELADTNATIRQAQQRINTKLGVDNSAKENRPSPFADMTNPTKAQVRTRLDSLSNNSKAEVDPEQFEVLRRQAYQGNQRLLRDLGLDYMANYVTKEPRPAKPREYKDSFEEPPKQVARYGHASNLDYDADGFPKVRNLIKYDNETNQPTAVRTASQNARDRRRDADRRYFYMDRNPEESREMKRRLGPLELYYPTFDVEPGVRRPALSSKQFTDGDWPLVRIEDGKRRNERKQQRTLRDLKRGIEARRAYGLTRSALQTDAELDAKRNQLSGLQSIIQGNEADLAAAAAAAAAADEKAAQQNITLDALRAGIGASAAELEAEKAAREAEEKAREEAEKAREEAEKAAEQAAKTARVERRRADALRSQGGGSPTFRLDQAEREAQDKNYVEVLRKKYEKEQALIQQLGQNLEDLQVDLAAAERKAEVDPAQVQALTRQLAQANQRLTAAQDEASRLSSELLNTNHSHRLNPKTGKVEIWVNPTGQFYGENHPAHGVAHATANSDGVMVSANTKTAAINRLRQQLRDGEITQAEFNSLMRELNL